MTIDDQFKKAEKNTIRWIAFYTAFAQPAPLR